LNIAPLDTIPQLIGTETGRSEWFAIDQERISAFADATLDHQWIHVDEDAASAGPFGATIAHGFLTLSLLPFLSSDGVVVPEGVRVVLNYGTNKVRFLNPVVVGSRIRAVSTLRGFEPRGEGRFLITTGVTVEIEGEDTPALVAETLTLAIVNGPSGGA
jgi:acyl dehydratase